MDDTIIISGDIMAGDGGDGRVNCNDRVIRPGGGNGGDCVFVLRPGQSIQFTGKLRPGKPGRGRGAGRGGQIIIRCEESAIDRWGEQN